MKSGKVSLSSKIDADLKHKLQEIANYERRSLSNMIEIFLFRGVHTHEGEDHDAHQHRDTATA